MNFALPASLRKSGLVKSVPAVGLLALSTLLAGCGPENGEQILPYVHGAGIGGGGGQLVAMPLTDSRHHAHTSHITHPRRHALNPG